MFEIVARSASARPARPSPANSTNEPTTPNERSISVITSTRSVAVDAVGSSPVEPHADDPGHRLVQRLAEQDGLGLDPADAVAEDAEPVDHRRVRVRAHERVGVGDAPVGVLAVRHDRRQVLEVDLVDDPRSGGHDAQVAERGLRPAQQLVALAVALVLALHVDRERARAAPRVDLHRVVDDEVRGHQRVDLRRVAAEVRHRVAHRGEVDDRRDAREVLEDDPCRHERDLGLARAARAPRGQRRHVVLADDAAARVPDRVLEQDLERDGRPPEVDAERQPRLRHRVEPVDVREARAHRGSGSECVGPGHGDPPRGIGR